MGLDALEIDKADRHIGAEKPPLCLAELILAVDTAPRPPLTPTEQEAWAREWQPREMELRQANRYPRRSRLPLDAHEVRSVVETMRFRRGRD